MTTAAAAETDDTATGASPAEAAAASGPSDGAFDPYALELYDAVPDHLSERHDDVDYGTVDTDVEYYSETAGDVKYCNVLLPAGYDPSQEYPVLYMYHGFGGRYDSHVHEDSILQTLYGNMLHEGLTVPMIIVGADMYTDLLSEKEAACIRLSQAYPRERQIPWRPVSSGSPKSATSAASLPVPASSLLRIIPAPSGTLPSWMTLRSNHRKPCRSIFT